MLFVFFKKYQVLKLFLLWFKEGIELFYNSGHLEITLSLPFNVLVDQG